MATVYFFVYYGDTTFIVGVPSVEGWYYVRGTPAAGTTIEVWNGDRQTKQADAAYGMNSFVVSTGKIYWEVAQYSGTLTVEADAHFICIDLYKGVTHVYPPPTLSATLSASPSVGPVPLAVTFTIGISGGVTPYTWTLDYGDGSTPGSGTIAGTKAHTYTNVGTFTATLTVTDALGASIFSRAVAYAGVLPIPDIVLLISGLAPLIAVASVVAASELQKAHVFG